MSKPLSPDLHFLLSEYLKFFIRLRPDKSYPGSTNLIADYEKIKNWTDADNFFETYGVGNKIFILESPFERVHAYELLLYILYSFDKEKYSRVHKGTPYYFIAWTAFQTANFEKSLFYMDAAVIEDLRIFEERGNKLTPAMKFFLLDNAEDTIGLFTMHLHSNFAISKALTDFGIMASVDLNKQRFVDKFVKAILFDKAGPRSLITALYGFILEYGSYERQFFLKNPDAGSIEPFVNNLFKGARVLESILGIRSSKDSLDKKIEELSKKLSVEPKKIRAGRGKSLDEAIKVAEKMKGDGDSLQDYSFTASLIVRNSTGHTLLQENVFKNSDDYEKLYSYLKNSILWSIYQLWINV